MSSDKYQQDEQRWRQLMIESLRGEQPPYEQLLDEIGNVLDGYLRLRFGQLDVIEDCVQECLIAIHQAKHTYNPKRAFRPWMFTIAKHRTIDILRQRSSRIKLVELAENKYPSQSDLENINGVIDGLRILQSLKTNHREAVVLTKYAGMTTLEAASWLGVSESAIKSRLRKGLHILRKQLESEA